MIVSATAVIIPAYVKKYIHFWILLHLLYNFVNGYTSDGQWMKYKRQVLGSWSTAALLATLGVQWARAIS